MPRLKIWADFMKALLLLTTLLLLPACSGESAASFTDAGSAMDMAEQALASKDYATAIAGFEFAAADGALAADALLGLFIAQLGSAEADAAQRALDSLKTHHTGALSTDALIDLANACINSGDLPLAERLVSLNQELHPNQMEAMRTVMAGIEAKRSGNMEALAELGYVGD